MEVSDDGVGGANAGDGSGLRGLSDRVAALSGTLEVSSPPGRGTRLRAQLPCRERTANTAPRGRGRGLVPAASRCRTGARKRGLRRRRRGARRRGAPRAGPRAPARRRRHRHPDAADAHRRGRARRRRHPRRAARHRRARPLPVRQGALRVQLLGDSAAGVGYLLKDRVMEGRASRKRCGRWHAAGPRSTPRWSPRCSNAATRRPIDQLTEGRSGTCLPAWPRDAPTPRSRATSASARHALQRDIASIFGKLDLPGRRRPPPSARRPHLSPAQEG